MSEIRIIHAENGRVIRFSDGTEIFAPVGKVARPVRHLGLVDSQRPERIQAGPAYTPTEEPHAIEKPWEARWSPSWRRLFTVAAFATGALVLALVFSRCGGLIPVTP